MLNIRWIFVIGIKETDRHMQVCTSSFCSEVNNSLLICYKVGTKVRKQWPKKKKKIQLLYTKSNLDNDDMLVSLSGIDIDKYSFSKKIFKYDFSVRSQERRKKKEKKKKIYIYIYIVTISC